MTSGASDRANAEATTKDTSQSERGAIHKTASFSSQSGCEKDFLANEVAASYLYLGSLSGPAVERQASDPTPRHVHAS